ncbi:hypothetical protein SERLA73DRAFT_184781 [Serpula lacrymans var. lacrymans S7.3]|uniref:Uncharacterized protein n=1 Tax=Serpula lacrymans var. lacrymans (strain S7.3) TaxID=936435 RepID=F8Q541_SERL3|nr:hypothetical protein SERLA73DRAFT_184781 [Serpula lacrymans var. lacrymans S7.3]
MRWSHERSLVARSCECDICGLLSVYSSQCWNAVRGTDALLAGVLVTICLITDCRLLPLTSKLDHDVFVYHVPCQHSTLDLIPVCWDVCSAQWIHWRIQW